MTNNIEKYIEKHIGRLLPSLVLHLLEFENALRMTVMDRDTCKMPSTYKAFKIAIATHREQRDLVVTD
jgi:hypothetical protein